MLVWLVWLVGGSWTRVMAAGAGSPGGAGRFSPGSAETGTAEGLRRPPSAGGLRG